MNSEACILAGAMLSTDYSHTSKFTGYMGKVFDLILSVPGRQRILDIPAGNGILSGRLRELGHDVARVDINGEHPDYIATDLNKPLPFADADFDTVFCLEGIEHVLDPQALIAEFCRITRPGGRIIISTPNIQNAFSRLRFLCTGFFYQYGPWMSRQLAPGEFRDRGHIAPLTYLQMRYHFALHGAEVLRVDGDKWKRKILIPLVLPFIAWGWLWARWAMRIEPEADRAECEAVFRDMWSTPLLFGRSLILTFRKKG